MSTSGDGGKPPQSGLVDMGNISFYNDPTLLLTFNLSDLANYPGSFSEIVLNVTWAQLQAAQGGPLDTSFIDSAISALNAYNATTATNVGIKLRVWGGNTAPDWAKSIDGPPITITGGGTVDPNLTTPEKIGRFWTVDYIDAWTSFQNALAAAYDNNPVIRGISNTAGASATDEPFVPLKFIPVNQVAMLQASGYTDAAQELTLRAGIADYVKWSTTPLDYTMNLFHLYDSGKDTGDETFTLAVLQQAKNSTRLVQAGNHALNEPLPSADSFIYAQMAGYAALEPATAPGSYQTASPVNLDNYANWTSTLLQGVGAGAGDIEIWDNPASVGFLGLLPGDLQAFAALFAAGNPPLTGPPDDGSALGFIAPAVATGAANTVAFSGVNAVLLARGGIAPFFTVTLTSTNGGTLAVTDLYGIVRGPTSGPTLTLSGQLAVVNTVLASLTDTLPSATDIVQISVTDSSGNKAVRSVGAEISPLAASSGAITTIGVTGQSGSGDAAIQGQLAGSGILVVGGVQRSVVIPGDLKIGGGDTSATLLAALAPSAYSTATLTVGGALEVRSGGTAHFSGALGAGTVTVDSGGAISGDGTLSASVGGAIVNNGTIEAAADLTLGLQQLTVANALSGSGKLLVDPGASLTLGAAVGPNQTIQFSPNSIAQFSNDPYSPSTLVLQAPQAMQGAIRGFSFADRLVLAGVTASGASYNSTTGTLTVDKQGGGSLSFALSGDLAGLTPVVSAASTIAFVAPPSGLRPSVVAPATLEGAVGMAVVVPDIVLNTPPPASPPANATITVTLVAGTGMLSFANNGIIGKSLTLSDKLGAVERSLQTLTYTGAVAGSNDTITITVSDDAGISAPRVVSVFNHSAPLQFNWASPAGGSFSDPANWTANGASGNTPPGGGNVASFGPGSSGAYAVSGDGAVGQILATATTTLTGQVTPQGRSGVALIVDSGGALTLAGGAELSAQAQVTVGNTGQGLLTLMGGALDLTGASTSNALVIGANAGSTGAVLTLEQITAAGMVVVGQAGSGTLGLLGVASTVLDGAADVGQSAGAQGTVTVNGGYWATAGQLTVGDLGNGSLLINGMANGTTGQATAFDATIGSEHGSQGSVTLDHGDLLIADVIGATSTLIVGGHGNGSLTIANGSEVAVGVAGANNNGMLAVGGTAGGTGQVGVGDHSALLVFGNASVGGAAGAASMIVGLGAHDTAVFGTIGTLAVGATGQITLVGAESTVRASVVDIAPGGLVSGSGTLSGIGGGTNTVTLASIDNDGAIVASGGNLLLYGRVTGAGALSVANGATLTVQAAVGAGQTLTFNPNAHAVLNDPRAFAGTIAGFGSGDVLELANTRATKATWSAGVLTLDTDSASIRLSVAGTYASNAFVVQADGLGGTNVQLVGGTSTLHMTSFDGV